MNKTYVASNKDICRVTFKLPKEIEARTVNLVGEFNKWDKRATPMKRQKDGSFSVTLDLPAGQEFRFRYLLDDTLWENDWDADSYVPNGFDSEDSVVNT
ncbi:MAG TPA: isoamylase early set domain-containing protein [Anaerolineae bacterium]